MFPYYIVLQKKMRRYCSSKNCQQAPRRMPPSSTETAKDNDFHLRPVPPPSNYLGSTVTMGGRLIPIPLSWAPFFLG